MVLIVAGTAGVLLVLWVVSSRRRLAVMDENVNNAMVQIGVQFSTCFDALTELLDLTGEYAEKEARTLLEAVRSRRSAITAASTPEDVLRQETVISEALARISLVAEWYPDLKANEKFTKYWNAMDSYEKMVRTSCLIYNDSVTGLNRELQRFPVSLIAGAFCLQRRNCIQLL